MNNEPLFWQSGYHNLKMIQSLLEHASTTLRRDQTVVELGCGVGRISVPVSEQVSRLIAYDISQPHLDLAKKHALDVGRSNIEFRLHNPRQAIDFDPCDLFYSFIVLQHNTPPVIYATLDAAFSCLRAGGVALFQVPTFAMGYTFSADVYLNQTSNETDLEMHCLPQQAIFDLARKHEMEIKLVMEDDWVGNRLHYVSNTFVLRKVGSTTS